MDIRICSRVRPDYNTRVLWSQRKGGSFAESMKTEAANRDTLTISQKTTEQRLEDVHKVVSEMDFTGKTGEEVYKAINDAYEDEFGFFDRIAYLDNGMYDKIYADRKSMFNENVPGYKGSNSREFYYRAMGYDKMTTADKINAISERIGGTGYLDRMCFCNEMGRAKILTGSQQYILFDSIMTSAGKEYCERNGLDYIQWNSGGQQNTEQNKTFMNWCAKEEASWLEIFSSIHDSDEIGKLEKDLFFEQIADLKNLLLESDK